MKRTSVVSRGRYSPEEFLNSSSGLPVFIHEKGGAVWEAIYTVTEDLFRMNFVEGGGRDPRPTLFATSTDSGGTVIVMSRMAQR
jgi:hypothetical protein